LAACVGGSQFQTCSGKLLLQWNETWNTPRLDGDGGTLS
jgi:hypothetical protein